jgi:hypothetical protein
VKTDILTQDNLRVYNLDPKATQIVAVAGPDGHDPEKLRADHLPPGFRRIDADEWEKLHNQV